MRHSLIFLLLTLSSCGFHLSHREQPIPLEVAFVKGDSDGKLTADIIAEIEKQGRYHYNSEGAPYQLNVTILDSKNKTIGYHYDQRKLDQGRKKLTSNESRAKLLLEVSIIDTATKTTVLGPAHLVAFADYDHENYRIDHDELRFSLGQLADVDTAYDTVNIPLYRSAAKEIARYIQDHVELIEQIDKQS